MKILLSHFSKQFYLQIVLYLFVNGLFIFKYFPRYGLNAPFMLLFYAILLLLFVYLYNYYSNKILEKTFKIAYWVLFIIIILGIAGLLIAIDRYSVRVDRWSAITFFLDNLFQGHYPYAAHTHLSETNFPSPFPVWHFLHIPFYLLGDVGIGLIFFLSLTALIVKYFFVSYRNSFLFLFLLFITPAYWWEISVRSDGLSNAFLVFAFILWFKKKNSSLSNNFWLCVIVCGLIASTRLSALLPLAIFFFKPYLNLDVKHKIIFPLCVIGITFITFIPFIFWDTNNWIFFSRNPFMSQTSVGNSYILIVMMLLGVFMALQWKSTSQFFSISSLFIFIFMLSSQISLIYTRGIGSSFLNNPQNDISYFSLFLPYCLASLTNSINSNDVENTNVPVINKNI